MLKIRICAALSVLSLLVFSGISHAEFTFGESEDLSERVEQDYLDLIDQHVDELSREYNVTGETEALLARRAVKNYIIADLVDYTMLIFMAKYNVATGGIEMKKANAQIIRTLADLSESANDQMLENLNALRKIKGLPPVTELK